MLTPYRFTGQREESALGLYYYGARWYDPALGRFIQPDPLVPEPGNPQALNRYSYVLNNPLRYTDRTGHYIYEEEPDDPLSRPPEPNIPAMRSWTLADKRNVELFILAKLHLMAGDPHTLAISVLNAYAVACMPLSDVYKGAAIAAKREAYKVWANQVDTDSPWDFKSEVGERYEEDKIRVGPRQLEQDIVANITYGYAGRLAGFSSLELKGGAGAQQVWQHVVRRLQQGRSPEWTQVGGITTFFDPARDQAAIQIGIDLYQRYGLQVSVRNIQQVVYAHISELY